MKISEKTFVAIEYRLSLDSGEEVDRSPEGQPLSFVTGAGRIIPGLESALIGRETGENAKIVLEPEEGYGLVSEDLFREIPKSKFPADAEIQPGMVFQADTPRGPMPITVSRVNDDDTVTVDLNHPMAGKRLHFDVTIVEVREPLPEEVVPMPGGCACGPGTGEAGGPSGQGSCDPSNCGCG